jgi:hypothetical protein
MLSFLCQEALRRGSLARVAVNIREPAGATVERFVAEPQLLSPADGAARGEPASIEQLRALEGQLRASLLRLQYVDSHLPRLPEGCVFEVVAFTLGREDLCREEWAEEDEEEVAGPGGGTAGRRKGASRVVPIKSCSVEGAFRLQVFAEYRVRGNAS